MFGEYIPFFSKLLANGNLLVQDYHYILGEDFGFGPSAKIEIQLNDVEGWKTVEYKSSEQEVKDSRISSYYYGETVSRKVSWGLGVVGSFIEFFGLQTFYLLWFS